MDVHPIVGLRPVATASIPRGMKDESSEIYNPNEHVKPHGTEAVATCRDPTAGCVHIRHPPLGEGRGGAVIYQIFVLITLLITIPLFTVSPHTLVDNGISTGLLHVYNQVFNRLLTKKDINLLNLHQNGILLITA